MLSVVNRVNSFHGTMRYYCGKIQTFIENFEDMSHFYWMSFVDSVIQRHKSVLPALIVLTLHLCVETCIMKAKFLRKNSQITIIQEWYVYLNIVFFDRGGWLYIIYIHLKQKCPDTSVFTFFNCYMKVTCSLFMTIRMTLWLFFYCKGQCPVKL